MLGNEVVIVAAARTAIGKGNLKNGVYRNTHPSQLLGATYRAVLDQVGLDPAQVQEVIAGCVNQFGEQQFNIARNAWLHEGLPIETPALTIDRQCGSAQSAANLAASLIASDALQVAIASGVEHLGHHSLASAQDLQSTHGSAFTPQFYDHHNVKSQGLGAELIAKEYGISRAAMDELAVVSHQRAAKARDNGAFAREIVTIETPDGTVEHDQGIRPDTNVEALATLKPAFTPDGRLTAGTSSQISDGAASVLLMSQEKAQASGLRPRARIIDHVAVGCDPVKMLEGPIPATQLILERNKLGMADIDRTEINEAFASVVAAWTQVHQPDLDTVNVRGGAMALGHPLGSSGARLLTTLLHILEDEDQQLGLVTMCTGGGMGTATLIERL